MIELKDILVHSVTLATLLLSIFIPYFIAVNANFQRTSNELSQKTNHLISLTESFGFRATLNKDTSLSDLTQTYDDRVKSLIAKLPFLDTRQFKGSPSLFTHTIWTELESLIEKAKKDKHTPLDEKRLEAMSQLADLDHRFLRRLAEAFAERSQAINEERRSNAQRSSLRDATFVSAVMLAVSLTANILGLHGCHVVAYTIVIVFFTTTLFGITFYLAEKSRTRLRRVIVSTYLVILIGLVLYATKTGDSLVGKETAQAVRSESTPLPEPDTAASEGENAPPVEGAVPEPAQDVMPSPALNEERKEAPQKFDSSNDSQKANIINAVAE